MSKPVRIREIALKAKCTTATVSLALNNNERLPERTRRRIQKMAREMGYIPNRQAKSLSLGYTGVIGVIMPMASDPYYAAVLDALVQTASERELQLQVQFHRWAPAEEYRAIRQMAEARVDAILHYPARASYEDEEIREYLEKMRTPLCLLSNLSNSLQIPDGASAVVKDYAAETALLTEELLRQGHRHVDILHPTFSTSDTRAGHYEGLLKSPHLKVRIFSPPSGKQEEIDRFCSEQGLSPHKNQALISHFIESYIAAEDRAPVVLTSNFRVAWGLSSAMAKHQLRCPEDLAIISIGHRNGGDEGILPLTALEYDPQEIAAQAFELITARRGELPHKEVRKIAPQFFYRESYPCQPTLSAPPLPNPAMTATSAPLSL